MKHTCLQRTDYLHITKLMTTSTPSFAHVAIDLNNIGVEILQKGACGSASMTFHDAVAVMKHYFQARQGNQQPLDDQCKGHFEMIEQAKTRLRAATSSCASTNSRFHIQNIYGGNFDRPEMAIDTSYLYPILIGGCSHEESGLTDLHAAITLHNLAIAKYSMASSDPCTSKPEFRNLIRNEAVRIFKLAYVSIERYKGFVDNVFEWRRAVVLELAVLNGLIQALEWDKATSEIGELIDFYHFLEQSVTVMDGNLIWFHDLLNECAAAA